MKKMKHLSLSLMVLVVSALLVASCKAETPSAASSPLTRDEISRIDSLEQEWGQDLDKAGEFIRQTNAGNALTYTKKATAVISEIKSILIKRGHAPAAIDKLVAMESFTDAYTNLAKIAAYTHATRVTMNDFNDMRTLFDDTRKKLLIAEAKFHEAPQMQEICRQYLGVLDEFERNIRKLLHA